VTGERYGVAFIKLLIIHN